MTSFIRSNPILKNTSLKIPLGISVSFLTVVVVILSAHCIRKIRERPTRRRNYEIAKLGKKLDKHSRSFGLTIRKYNELELQLAASCFNNEIFLKGSHQIVYKGIIEDETVLIKRLNSEANNSDRKEFLEEASIISLINHRHVVRFLGYCADWNKEALVFEHVDGDTLYKHIHERREQSPTLSFDKRMKIAVQIAGALGYLHSTSNSKPSILHRGVNSKNIILEETDTARLIAFKEAKLRNEIESSVQKSAKFLPSEGIQSNIFKDKDKKKKDDFYKKMKDDVYGFGMLLVELLTSKKTSPVLPSLFFSAAEKDDWDKILDPEILINEGKRDTTNKVAKLAKKCLSSKDGKPSSMEEVAIDLGWRLM